MLSLAQIQRASVGIADRLRFLQDPFQQPIEILLSRQRNADWQDAPDQIVRQPLRALRLFRAREGTLAQ